MEGERYQLPYGAVISVGEGEQVEAGQVISQWDPHTHPIVRKSMGLEFVEMEDGLSVTRQTDELTGLTNIMFLIPRIKLLLQKT